MDLNLSRIDLQQVSSTSRRSLAILPQSKAKKKQKVVIGDNSGVVQCFGVKKGDVQSFFKTMPLGKRVTRVELWKDKIFTAIDHSIRGLSKKGKEFWKLDTNMTENITHFAVQVPHVWCAGEYVLNKYNEQGIEEGFYMSPDRINDLIVAHISNENEWDAVLACQDRMIRVVKDSQLIHEIEVEGSVTSLASYEPKNGNNNNEYGNNNNIVALEGTYHRLIYGTESGSVGCLAVNGTDYKKLWVISPSALSKQQSLGSYPSMSMMNGNVDGMGNPRKAAPVTCVGVEDFTKDNLPDILVGRDDGTVEVHSFDISPEPTLVFQKCVNESITSIGSGFVTNAQMEDLVVATYSGKIICFSTDPAEYSDTASATSSSSETSASSVKSKIEATLNLTKPKGLGIHSGTRIQALRKELEKLREKLDREKEKFAKMSSEMIAVHSEYKVKDKFILDSDSACYVLSIELDIPIDTVALQCNVPVDLLATETTGAIVCLSPINHKVNPNTHLLATYRCTDTTNRLEIRFRTIEGEYGEMKAFVIPKLTPKTCQLTTHSIKPLSLHERLNTLDNPDRPLNDLKITGSFSLSEMHSWVASCLPEVPEKTHDADEITYNFCSTFQKTILICKYRKGEAVFQSDNASTLSILKEYITKEATARKIRINIAFDIKDITFRNVLELLHPKLEYQLGLSVKVKLIEALKEIKLQEGTVEFMSPDYQEILENAEQLEREFKTQPRRLDFLCGIVRNLFVDKYKFKGQNVQHKVPHLMKLLEVYDLERVLDFFNNA